MDLSKTSLGLWVDNPRSEVLTPQFFDIVRAELKFDLVAVMIDQSDKDPTFSYEPHHVDQLLKLADPGALEVSLTTWPFPDKEHIDKQCAQMRKLMQVGPVAAWEVDLEHNWRSRKQVAGRWVNLVHGFRNIEEAGDYLVSRIREVCNLQDARFEMTSFTHHKENSPRATVAPEADRLLVQAYSVDERDDNPIPFTHTLGPGSMQKYTLDRTMKIGGVGTEDGPRLGVGLAAWAQRFEWRAPEEAMRTALEASLEYNPIDVRWWSSKHVINIKRRRANPYARQFLRSLRNP